MRDEEGVLREALTPRALQIREKAEGTLAFSNRRRGKICEEGDTDVIKHYLC